MLSIIPDLFDSCPVVSIRKYAPSMPARAEESLGFLLQHVAIRNLASTRPPDREGD